MTHPGTLPPPSVPAATLAEARAAYVGGRYHLFEESFNLFDDSGGFRPTFIWAPLVFGLFWFIYRRMYIEAALAFLAGLGLVHLSVVWGEGGEGAVMFMSFSLTLFMAVAGRWLYWRAVDRRLEQAMRLFPQNPDQALPWLKMKGGVDPLAVVIAIGIMAISIIGAAGRI